MADCHSVHCTGPTSSSSGGASARSRSTRRRPSAWSGDIQAKAMISQGSSPIPKLGGSRRIETMPFISSGRSSVQRAKACRAARQCSRR